MSKPTIRKGTISELTPDARNANKGTEYGAHLLEKSLSKLGAGRSILLDKHGNVIAGNKTLETAALIGMEDVIIVPSDGTKIIAVQRTDLDINSKKGRELALADNKVSQVNLDFDVDVISDLSADFDIDVTDWGFQAISDTPDEEETPKAAASEKITFALTTSQHERLRKALDTAILEKELKEGDDNYALMCLVEEYLGRRQ